MDRTMTVVIVRRCRCFEHNGWLTGSVYRLHVRGTSYLLPLWRHVSLRWGTFHSQEVTRIG